MVKRSIIQKVQGKATQDGAGVKLVRVLSRPNIYSFDPFLMLDAFDSSDPNDYILGFPWHPHRGIETITYLIEGKIEHQDSLGNKGVIEDGDCQWMSAGRGILHQEMPKAAKRMLGVQLWLNLSKKNKMTPPKYRDIVSKNIPIHSFDNVVIKILSGEFLNKRGAIAPDYVPLTFVDIAMEENAAFTIPTPINDTVFIYVVEGEVDFNQNGLIEPAKTAYLFSAGDRIEVNTKNKSARFFVFIAPPLHEPIAWGGPIVMNTETELQQAFSEIRTNTFIQ